MAIRVKSRKRNGKSVKGYTKSGGGKGKGKAFMKKHGKKMAIGAGAAALAIGAGAMGGSKFTSRNKKKKGANLLADFKKTKGFK